MVFRFPPTSPTVHPGALCCVRQSGERARSARLCDTHSVPSAKKKHSTNTTTQGLHRTSALHACASPARAHSVTHSAASLNARAARARTSEARVTPHAVHTRASFLKCAGLCPPLLLRPFLPSSSRSSRLACPRTVRSRPFPL